MKNNKMRIYNKCMIFSIFFVLGLFFNFNYVNAQENYDDKGIKVGVESNKNWIVKFNQILNKDTINNSNVIVTNENGQEVPCVVTMKQDKKSISISPKSQYINGKTYNLIIKDSLKSMSGRSMGKSAKMQFSVKDNYNPSSKNYVVCIDAAHGGEDLGNISQSGIKEKDIDLSVGLKVGKILENNGVKVVYTRSSDNVSWNRENDLTSRFNISNKSKADYFVSIRCNSYPEKPNVNGLETYYSNWNQISKKLAENVQSELVNNTGRVDRGVKEGVAQHEIIRGTTANAIMVELGFITNPSESATMATENFQNKSAEGIANGILKSLSLVDKSKDISIKSISDISASVSQGASYSLPLSVQATMSDGSNKNVGVVWENKSVNTSSSAVHTYKGYVGGFGNQVTLTLSVLPKTDEGDNTPTASGETICIDPGHGIGRDGGATGIGGLQEDDVTLSVGLKVAEILKSKGVNVVLTRTSDERSNGMTVTQSLQRRCDTSNNANAKYFVSIHCNSFDASSANGTETLCNESNPESRRLATAIQNSIVREVGTYSRGLKDGNWLHVVNNTNMPAVLTELGFLTNPTDASKLSSESYRNVYARAIANGILQCLGK